ncbi:hypothetical protein Tco_0218351 [Tanacetum coccineum]
MPPCYRSTYKRKVRGQETKDASVEPSSPVLFYEWNRLRSPREPADLKSQNSGKGLFGPNGRRGGKVGFDEFRGGGEEVGNCGGNGGGGLVVVGGRSSSVSRELREVGGVDNKSAIGSVVDGSKCEECLMESGGEEFRSLLEGRLIVGGVRDDQGGISDGDWGWRSNQDRSSSPSKVRP